MTVYSTISDCWWNSNVIKADSVKIKATLRCCGAYVGRLGLHSKLGLFSSVSELVQVN